MRTQLQEQRREASKAREYAAAADFAAAVEHMIHNELAGDTRVPVFEQLQSARIRWGFEVEDRNFMEELKTWPYLLQVAHLKSVKEDASAEDQHHWDELARIARAACATYPKNPQIGAALTRRMKAARNAFDPEWYQEVEEE
ncbi:hypothetical protein [Arthrobacter burdickii]|uniref:Uncharacterized protein n=1 Tax=Arthrobacter burdickii TaxID=3035920 RepID=A0ABT8K3B3_9MICC|nr:hypothetical protein [Arthrobacter burdickii]MDN4611933.1 hypothetical protein [Arthrobacter burdickii]